MKTLRWQEYVEHPDLEKGCAVVVKATGQRGVVCALHGFFLVEVILEGFEVAVFKRGEIALLGNWEWGSNNVTERKVK